MCVRWAEFEMHNEEKETRNKSRYQESVVEEHQSKLELCVRGKNRGENVVMGVLQLRPSLLSAPCFDSSLENYGPRKSGADINTLLVSVLYRPPYQCGQLVDSAVNSSTTTTSSTAECPPFQS